MNGAHAHLLINHLPIFGLFFAFLLLLVAFFRRSRELQIVALCGTLLVAVGTIPAYLTGEPAEHVVEEMPGVEHDLIEEHEEAAEVSFIVVELLGVMALGGLLFHRGGGSMPRWYGALMLLVTMAAAGLIGWTSNLGGEIRHPEIRAGASAADPGEADDGEAGDETEKENDGDGRGRGRGRGGR